VYNCGQNTNPLRFGKERSVTKQTKPFEYHSISLPFEERGVEIFVRTFFDGVSLDFELVSTGFVDLAIRIESAQFLCRAGARSGVQVPVQIGSIIWIELGGENKFRFSGKLKRDSDRFWISWKPSPHYRVWQRLLAE
jgi:hypothetical protein